MAEEPTNQDAPKEDPKGEKDTPQGESKTFSQDELDRIVGRRVHEVREKFTDYDDLKAAAAKLETIESQSKSDLERALEERDSWKQKTEEASTTLRDTLLRSEVVAQAAKAGAIDPSDVVTLLPTGSVTVDDDGNVTGAEEAVKELLEAKPHLVGKQPSPNFDGGARIEDTTNPGVVLAGLEDPKAVVEAVQKL